MADREVTTRFRADVSDFKANVKAMNSEMKLANSEFKAATAGMDDWRKSTEGIQAKLRQLNTNLTAQKSVLQSLEQQYREVVAAQGEDSAAALRLQTQLNNQAAAVAATEREIRNYEQSLEDLNDTSEQYEATNQVLSETFGTLAKAGAAAFAAIGAAAIAGLTKSLSLANDSEKAMNSFAAETGVTAKELEGFEDAMENIYKNNFGESFDDIAQSMSEIKKQAGDMGADELEDVTQNALMLKDTFEYEVNESFRAAKMMMDQFGLSGEEAYNLIAQGAQGGLDKNGDLLDSINEYSVHFEQLGFSAEDMFNILKSGSESGTFSVDKLGDAMKEFGIRTKDGSDTSAAAFEALGYDADEMFTIFSKGGEGAAQATQDIIKKLAEMEPGVEQTTAGVNLFGTMWEDLGIEGIKALGNVNGEISLTKDALDQINQVKYNDIGSAIEGIKRNLEMSLLKPIGEAILPKVNELAAKFQEWLADPKTQAAITDLSTSLVDFAENTLTKVIDAAKWFLDNKDVIIAGLAGIAAGFLAFKVVSIIQAVKTAMDGMTISQYALNLAMSLNPIGLVIAAITGLVAAFIVLWNKSDAFREFWIDLWEKIKEFAGEAGEWISEKFSAVGDFFKGIGDKIGGFWDDTKKSVADKFTAVKDVMGNIMGAAKDVVSEKLNNIKDAYDQNGGGIQGAVAAAWTGMKEYWTAGFDFVNQLTNGKLDGIKKKFDDIWNAITKFIADAWNNIKKNFTDSLNNISKTVTTVWNTIKTTITTVFNTIKTTITNIINNIKTIITNAFNNIKTTITTVLNVIKTTVTTIWNAIKSTIQTVINSISSTVSSVFNTIKNTISNAWNSVKSTTSSIWNGIKSTVSSVVNGISSTVSTAFNTVKNTISNTLDSAKNSVANIFNSIKSTISSVMNSASSAVGNAINTIKSKFDFSWSLPKLKLPHFTISGGFSLNPPSVPKFSISWYKKGGLMDGATMFGLSGTDIKVGGEAGKEAILPLENNTGGWANLLATVLLKELNKITNLNGITDIAKQLTASLDQSNNTLVNNLARQMQNYQTALVSAMQNANIGTVGAPSYTIHQTITNTKTSEYEIYRATRNAVTLFK